MYSLNEVKQLRESLTKFLDLQKRLGIPSDVEGAITRIEDLIFEATVVSEVFESIIEAINND